MGEMIQLPGQPKLSGYVARPDGRPKAAILVIHEVWGLVDHIKSIADRFAQAGYLALAPDLLSETDIRAHATGELQEALFDPERRSAAQPKLRELMAPLSDPAFGARVRSDLRRAFAYLASLPDVGDRVAVIGFCFGGTYAFNLAADERRLKAAIVFYGHTNLTGPELASITCPIRAFYGERDERLVSDLPELKKKMAAANVDFVAKVYPDAGHAFFNDSNRFAYRKDAATDAWPRVLDFLNQVFT